MNAPCFFFAEERGIAHFWKKGNSKKGSNNFKIEKRQQGNTIDMRVRRE